MGAPYCANLRSITRGCNWPQLSANWRNQDVPKRIATKVIKLNHFDKTYGVIMGGWGSGRKEKGVIRAYVEQFPRLTLSRLLTGWRGSVDGYIHDDRLVVDNGCQSWVVDLDATQHRLGGKRRWMLCPQCRSRCAVLYLRGAPACRRCHGLTYFSKTRHAASRIIGWWTKSWPAIN